MRSSRGPAAARRRRRVHRHRAGIVGIQDCAVSWADYDTDGDLDVALTGGAGNSGMLARIYRNTAGTFTDASISPSQARRLRPGRRRW